MKSGHAGSFTADYLLAVALDPAFKRVDERYVPNSCFLL